MSKLSVAAVVVVVAVIASRPARVDAQARTAPQVLADVQATYATATGMTAVFEQKVTNVTFGRTHVVQGKVWLSRPRKMRWDYNARPVAGQATKTARSFVSDGTTLWMVDTENQQIVVKSVKDNLLPIAVAFLSGTATWSADFRAQLDASGTYGASGDKVVLLTPKTPSTQYKKLYLVVDPTTSQVRESIIIDAAGNTNQFAFASVDLTATNPDRYFVVDPAGAMFARYRVIDMLAPAPAPTAPSRTRSRRP